MSDDSKQQTTQTCKSTHVLCTRNEVAPKQLILPVEFQLKMNAAISIKAKKGSPYIRRVPKLIPVLGSQPAGDMSHKSGGRLPLLSARPAGTPATLKRAATDFAAW